MNEHYPGSCLCGRIRFQVLDFAGAAAHCHCTMCRKFHGAAFATLASVNEASLRWISGEDCLKFYTAANGTIRGFCGECGSSILFKTPRAPAGIVEIAVGTMDVDIPVTPSAHIFVESRANWDCCRDGLPGHRRGRDSDSQRYEVCRVDDNGNEFVIQADLSFDEAKALVDQYEARGHKQLYWARPIGD